MSILFETIPSNLLVPGVYTETNKNRAASQTPALPKRAVVLGHRLSGGVVAAGTPFRVFNESDAEYGAGAGSYLAESLIAFKKVNPYCELWGIGVADDGAAVAATGTFAFTGTATAAGTLVAYVGPYWQGSALRGRYTVAVTVGMTAAQLATALTAAVQADPYRVGSAGISTATVTITARNAGLNGNAISLSLSHFDGERLPAGLACVVTGMASGATNPSVSAAIAALGDQHTTHIVLPWHDATSLTAIETEARRRWGGTVQRETHVFTGAVGSLATLTTLGDGRNSEFVSVLGVGLSPTPPWIAAAQLAAVDAAQADPSLALRGLELPCMVAPGAGSEFDGDDRQALLADGITTYTIDSAGKCYVERIVTTYQEDANGNADATFRDRQVTGTLFALRYDWRTYFGAKYPRHKHAADGTLYDPGLPIVTPSTVAAEFAGRARTVWAQQQGWIEDPEQFLADILIERTEDGMDMVGVPNLINRLHVVRTRFDFLR